jgi:hypothetical protein
VSYGDCDSQPVTGKTYKPAGKPCNICGGVITWQCRIDGKPCHVDASGYAIGDGCCPGPKKKLAPNAKYVAVARPPTPGNFVKLFEEARVKAIQSVARIHEAILIAEHIIGTIHAETGQLADKAAVWNAMKNSEREAWLAGKLEQVGFPTEQPMHAAALIARADAESRKWFAGSGVLDVLLNWAEIARIDLGFEVLS